MKKIFINSAFLLAAFAFIAGCAKSDASTTILLPAGNFSGTFIRIHKNSKNVVDTIKANLNLTMSASTGYAITGDTSKHAGSHGSYVVDGTNILFADNTIPAGSTVITTKIHLNGVYQYTYSGPSLQISFTSDTLTSLYNMTAH